MNIIITGTSKGIGFECVKAFAKDAQHNILAVSRDQLGLEKLIADCDGSRVFPLVFDLTEKNYNSLIKEALKHFQRVDILINNAGKLVNKPFDQFTEADFDEMFAVNVKSVFRLIQLLLPYMAENSHIVNIGSMGGFQGSAKFPGLALYSASKGALAILTECLAEEFQNQRISVNCLALGSAQTQMFADAFPGYQASLSAVQMAGFIKEFAISGHRYFNGKILPVSLSTP